MSRLEHRSSSSELSRIALAAMEGLPPVGKHLQAASVSLSLRGAQPG